MTISEALAAKVQCPVSTDTLDVALTDRALDGAATYTVADKSNVEKAVMDVLYMVYTQPDIVEGGYSLSHPGFLEKIKARLLQLAQVNDATDLVAALQPTVTGKNVW